MVVYGLKCCKTGTPGNGGNDSPGHSAKYCICTLMDHDTKDIVELAVVYKREVGLKSPNMERLGKDLVQERVVVSELVTDAHSSITDMLIPLQSIDVAVTVHGYIAEVLTTMCYKNEEYAPIEAFFVFPVDDQSAVYKFQAFIDGRLIEGECQEKEQANITYEDALEKGLSAFLMQESKTTGDVFECRVGNLPPTKEAEISFAYVIELGVEANGDTKFIYPCVLCPRYSSPELASATDAGTNGAGAEAEMKTKQRTPPPVHIADVKDLTYTTGVMIEVFHEANTELSMWLEDAANYTSSYVSDEMSRKMTVKNPPFDQDLILYIRTKEAFSPHVLLERGNPTMDSWFLQKDIAMVNFCPSFETTGGQGSGEYIFVVDRSGSMSGESMHYAKEALGKFLGTLPEDCYFNIIGFGSKVETLFKNQSKMKNVDTMKQARELQNTMEADLGGTEMIKPFKLIYNQSVIKGYPRQIFLLTDGQIWDTDVLITLVKKHQGQARVFTFGIGIGASSSLLLGVARAGRGRAEFITKDLSKLPEKVKRTLGCAMSPYVENVELHWKAEGQIEVTRIPRDIPPIFDGERLIVYGLLKSLEPASQTITVELTGKINGKTELSLPPVTFNVGSDDSSQDVLPIHRLAAKAQIKELQDQETRDDPKKDQIVLLSTSANIISRHTAFVGVDKGPVEKTQKLDMTSSRDRIRTRYVPLATNKSAEKKLKSVLVCPGFAGDTACRPKCMGMFGGSWTRSRTRSPRRRFSQLDLPTDKVMFTQSPLKGSSSCQVVEKKDNRLMSLFGKCKVKSIHYKSEQLVDKSSIIPATHLSPGDNVLIFHRYSWLKFQAGKVLEFDQKSDEFCIAKLETGTVNRHKAGDITLSCEEAKKLKDRSAPNTSKQVVYTYTMGESHDALSTTAESHDTLPATAESHDTLHTTAESRDALPTTAESHDALHTTAESRDALPTTAESRDPLDTTAELRDPSPSDCEGSDDGTEAGQSYGLPYSIDINTSDLAELAPDADIGRTVIEFYLMYLTKEMVFEIDGQASYIFSSMFFKALADPEKNRKDRYETVRPGLKNLDLSQTEVLFVPIFNEEHWCVIAVRMENRKPTSAKEPIRLTFSVMDGYCDASRTDEILLLKDFLVEVFDENLGHPVTFDCKVKHSGIPSQNKTESGLCMLLCIRQCFKENLNLEPDMKWISPTETKNFRKDISKIIIDGACW